MELERELERAQPIQHPPERFRFTGSGGEYFQIWIVNLLLTIGTLGIYSAWAKVRRLQYFYRHTQLAGSVFDYHGSPIAILIGRVIGLALLIAYSFAEQVSLLAWAIAAIAVGLLLPWLLRNSFRFRLRYSSYRGLRFSFRGSQLDAYITFLVYGLLTVVTAYLAAPLFHQRMKRYQHGQSWFGATRFSFSAGVGAFYAIYLLILLILIGGFIVGGSLFGGALLGLSQIEGENARDPAAFMPMLIGFIAMLVILSLIIGPVVQAKIGNLVWNNTRLGAHRFESRLRVWPLIFIQFTNFVLVLLTLGLFIPWAAVRVARYRAECMSLLPATPLDEFLADNAADVTATGEETAELFDLDIGL